MDSKKVIAGLLAGAAIGVAIGILLSPGGVEQARRKLVKGSRKLTDGLKVTLGDSVESLKDRFNTGVDEVIKNGKEMINHASERVKG